MIGLEWSLVGLSGLTALISRKWAIALLFTLPVGIIAVWDTLR